MDRPQFDLVEFDRAFVAADFERCHSLVDGKASTDALLAAARLCLRERKYLPIIETLTHFPEDADHEARIARDIYLGAAFGNTRDYVAGRRYINRALNDLVPGDRLYYDALYHLASIAWMQHEHREAEEIVTRQLEAEDPNIRARAHIMLSWVAVRRSDVFRQVEELEKALDELESAEYPDEYYRANSLFTLALLCRELPLPEATDRVRSIYQSLPWTSGLKLDRFQVTRFLAAIDELEGNELAAFSGFKKAGKLAPSDHWSVLCYLDRALLAKNTGESAFASEQLEEAHETAMRLSWNEVANEERSALLVLAQMFAEEDACVAEQYLARFRSLGSNVIPILAYGSDPRVRGFEAYSQGVAWLRLGDLEEGKNALTEAWSIFENYNYGWRAALCALGLFEATNDRRWIERAARKIAPWPNSWIAKRISSQKEPSVVPMERIPAAKREVLDLIKSGRRNSEIAQQLGRSPNTVRNQLSQLYQVFDVKSRTELVEVLSQPVVSIARRREHQRTEE